MSRLITVDLAKAKQEAYQRRARIVVAHGLLAPVGEGIDPFAKLTNPPGLVGDLTEWICSTARRPSRVLALGAAISVVGTIVGLRASGPSRSGTHLYIAALGPTGCGKQAALDGIQTALSKAGAQNHLGPPAFTALPALINFLKRQPLAVCPMDEFGAFLRRVQNPKASGWERAISGILRTAWGSSFRQFQTLEYAGLPAEWIGPAALSLFGVSTPDEFFEALNADDIANGLLNRFLLLQTDVIAADREPEVDPFVLPPDLAARLARLFRWKARGNLGASVINISAAKGPDIVSWGAGAEEVWRGLQQNVDDFMRTDRERAAYVVRTAEIAVRLATIVAVGRAGTAAYVEKADVEWGRDLALASARLMAAAGTANIVEVLPLPKLRNRIVEITRRKGGSISRSELMRALGGRIGKSADVDEALKILFQQELVVEERGSPPFSQSSRPQTTYRLNQH